uniref:Uncharacterized protein AlNc14C296G10300 n=1 Tax=Albugo laibachii Nc14 TaxID=890382 RepID=F0WVG5_9STRA|nr:hypothetical protein TRIADDRAFT_5525 [Albugo laibachii Nc14]|eukprot:CCA25406.1 hypothetical protein TRIADDRAFT_5525 [Albugo laibachii Nc14]
MMQKPSSPNTSVPLGASLTAENVTLGLESLTQDAVLGSSPVSGPTDLSLDPTEYKNGVSRKRKSDGNGNLTIEQKRRICEKHRATPKITQKDLCRWAKLEFNLKKAPTQPTMSNILKNAHLFRDSLGGALGADRKTIRPTRHAHFDQVLANWVMERQAKGNITGDMIKNKGRELAKQMGLDGKLGFSNGWLASFKTRHGLIRRGPNLTDRLPVSAGMSTQSSSPHIGLSSHEGPPSFVEGTSMMLSGVDESPAYALPPVSADLPLEQIQMIMRNYASSDLYTVDESGLFYRAPPSKLVHGDDAQAMLVDEARLTVLLAVNADASDLMDPYIIGNILPPRNMRNMPAAQAGYQYMCSSKSRMTVFIFQQWLRDFNARMASSHRNVLLLMDNAPSHVLGCVQLTNVRVIMVSPQLGMKVQPMRGGIMAAFKGKYRLKHLTLAIDHLEDGLSDIYRVTQLQAMRWITESWHQVPREVILNAWKPLGLHYPFEFEEKIEPTDEKNVEEELWNLLYCLQLSGIVNTKVLVNSRWENDIHKRLNEDIIEDPQVNDEEFKIPDTLGMEPNGVGELGEEETIPLLTAKEQLKSFRDVIRYLEQEAVELAI